MLGIELLQVALGIHDRLSRIPDSEAWEDAYRFAQEQAIVGVLWPGILALRKQSSPEIVHLDKELLMDWLGEVNRLRERNKEMDVLSERVCLNFRNAGFECMLLKGQSNARLYEEPGAKCEEPGLIRTPGDVDVWVKGQREAICRYLRDNVPGYDPQKEGRLHTSFDWHPRAGTGQMSTTVEVHFTATYFERTRYDRRLQDWLQEDHTWEDFNLVYLMLHMYRHYLFEGIGLRHVVDYVLLMRRTSEEQHSKALETLKWLGASVFSRAMLELIGSLTGETELSSWRGRMLWRTIAEGGNFGQADKRNSQAYREWGWRRVWRFVSRTPELLVAYPGEMGAHALCKLKV